MSLMAARLQPRPTAGPFTAATIGTLMAVIPRTIAAASSMIEGAQRGVGRHPLEEMKVTATAEGPARAGDDDGACVAVGRELRPDGRELAVQRLVGGIEGFGPVEGHEPHRAVLLDGEVLVRRHRLPRFESLGAAHGRSHPEPRDCNLTSTSPTHCCSR